MTDDSPLREGEIRFSLDREAPWDAGLRYIGRIHSPWTERTGCPKNLRQARERNRTATVQIDPPFHEALPGLEVGSHAFILTFLDQAGRDLALQKPRHAETPRGTFSLRSPVRPNPIGLHLVKLLSIDRATGVVIIDAIDVLDQTPILDIKPFHPGVDIPPTEDV